MIAAVARLASPLTADAAAALERWEFLDSGDDYGRVDQAGGDGDVANGGGGGGAPPLRHAALTLAHVQWVLCAVAVSLLSDDSDEPPPEMCLELLLASLDSGGSADANQSHGGLTAAAGSLDGRRRDLGANRAWPGGSSTGAAGFFA